ncbi:MAG TPA: hypothetical protein VL947_02755 [Cytophagales bacterium]|nr:hypothetical protein [Cytophagales bacterium]
MRNLLYVVWLTIYLLFMLSLGPFAERKYFLKLIRVYVYSNIFISIVGIVQFVLFFVGIDFYLAQVFASNFPRVNGFSYEPSYYATFLITGFVTNLYLLNHKSAYFSYPLLLINQALMFIAIFLSTSKLVIPIMLLSLLLVSFKDVLRKMFSNFSIYMKDLALVPILMLTLLIPIYYIVFDFEKVRFLFDGLGIAGGVSHSVTFRERDLDATYKAFTQSPVVGYSLGGVASAIGEIRGVRVTNNELAKENEGMNVFIETLAGSGIIGFLFFIWFLFSLFKKPLAAAKRLERKDHEYESGILLRALFWGGLILLFMLNFNQNILRPFLWIHFAMLNTAYFYAKIISKENNIEKALKK